MLLPEFILALPELEVPFSTDVVESRAMKSDGALLVFFIFHKDFELPLHSHKAQWGTVLQGSLTLTIGGETRSYGRGDSYSIGDGVEHGGMVAAGSILIDVFEENDRYPVKS